MSRSCSQPSRAPREKSCSPMRVLWSGFQFLTGKRRKTFTANRVKAQSVSRRQFAAMLRHPFPEATDREIARHWAPRLTVHERTVLNWLAETHSASIEDVFIVGATHGVWTTMAIMVGDRTREEFLTEMGQGK